MDEIFARIDAGEPLTGHAGLLKGMLKASLERGLLWLAICDIEDKRARERAKERRLPH